ncbi:MAG: hypothetical protein GOU98_03640 [Candidatus Altiarchaeota archaeon]|nr:hypothetical protein [Candidatus Altiarchaeota archaeon]
MGVLVKRCTYGAAVKDAKQQIVATISRYNEILRTSAKVSINVKPRGKTKFTIISKTGSTRHIESEKLNDSTFKELLEATSFEIELELERKGPTVPKILFWYNEENHLGNSFGVEFIVEFAESLSFKFMSLLGQVNVIKAAAFRGITDSVANRLQSLFEDVMRMYVGGAMTKTEQVLNMRKYEVDSLMINIFGNIIKVREKN